MQSADDVARSLSCVDLVNSASPRTRLPGRPGRAAGRSSTEHDSERLAAALSRDDLEEGASRLAPACGRSWGGPDMRTCGRPDETAMVGRGRGCPSSTDHDGIRLAPALDSPSARVASPTGRPTPGMALAEVCARRSASGFGRARRRTARRSSSTCPATAPAATATPATAATGCTSRPTGRGCGARSRPGRGSR
jgi:hypothetical protein